MTDEIDIETSRLERASLVGPAACDNPARHDVLCWQPGDERRIDYVFVASAHDCSTPTCIRACKVVLNRASRGVWPSDHYAVCAEIGVIP